MSVPIHKYDVVVVGAGLAGCAAARELASTNLKVCVLTKLHPLRSHSSAAQGGINAVLDGDDSVKLHELDTIKGGDYLSDQDAVELLCNEAPKTIKWIETMGAIFSRNKKGEIAQRSFGAQSNARTCYSKDRTGLTLLQTVFEQASKDGAEFIDEYYVCDLIYKKGKVTGVVAYNIVDSKMAIFNAKAVMFATGGSTRAYKTNSNSSSSTGDALSIVARNGLPLEDMEFIQFHPTGLSGSGILMSEAARGEGAMLYNSKNERFMEKYSPEKLELAPRDIISRAIEKEILEGRGCGKNKDFVKLDLTSLGEELINEKLPELRDLALTFLGEDAVNESISVAPTAHYGMGGIPCNINGKVRNNSKSLVNGFYAAGECACVSIHGANRLGANSLLEALFFGRNTAKTIIKDIKKGITFKNASQKDAKKSIDEIERIKLSNGEERTSTLRKELQESMSSNAGIFRSKKSLLKQIETIENLKQRFQNIRIDDKSNVYNTDLQEAIELGHMIDYSGIIAKAACERKESRGSHYRDDFKDRDDDNFLKHSMTYMQNNDIRVEYMDVILRNHKIEQRLY